MRHTEFRALMDAQFGPARARSVAADHFFAALGDRTADQALAAGINPKRVWASVCAEYDVPAELRYGLPD